MKAVKVTENYKAVLEGKLAKGEFVRQMRLQFPNIVTKFNGYDDTVQILKNKQMIFDAPINEAFENVKVYADRPALTYSLDALERGIGYELTSAGIMAHDKFNIKAEDYFKAEQKAKSNLDKDPNHYLNLLSGESSKVDKHDREEETKRGEGKVDVFNGLKKADLKEARVMLKEGKLEDLAARLGVDVNKLIAASDKIKSMEREKIRRDALKLEKVKEALSDEIQIEEAPVMTLEEKKSIIAKAIDTIKDKYKDPKTKKPLPHINSIINDFIKMHGKDLINGADIETEFDNFVDANFQGRSDMRDIEENKAVIWNWDGDRNSLEQVPPKFKLAVKAEFEGELSDEEFEEAFDAVKNFHADEAGRGSMKFNSDHWAEMIEMDYLEEKQGKDLNKDGNIDKHDYMAAKDAAIKKAMGKDEQLKEAIKTIIKKTLNDKALNEAATNGLASLSDQYDGLKGFKTCVIDLQNLVTEIESFNDRMQEKLQSVFNKTGDIENEDGLKVGAFLAPTIMGAFKKDMGPVIKGGYMKNIELPKTTIFKRPDPAMQEMPKQTIYSMNEDKGHNQYMKVDEGHCNEVMEKLKEKYASEGIKFSKKGKDTINAGHCTEGKMKKMISEIEKEGYKVHESSCNSN